MTSVDVAAKIMFEIYREREYNRAYRVVYFTELGDHNREHEINKAMAGEHFLDGFIAEKARDDAKRAISRIVEDLNSGDELTISDVRQVLGHYLID